ncbi:MAG: COX15/CtaA family protein [Isosphaeraceae bacterium]
MTTQETQTPGSHSAEAYRRGPHWMALFAALFTLPLLFVGGSVTTYRVGLAVPDWPTTFGMNMFLYDFWNAPFGVRVEHTHRLYGAAVGLATIGLLVCLMAFDSRRWLKVLGVVALAAVIIQGILGGTRVTEVSTLLAAVHGCTGQAFFGLIVAIAVFTGRDWAVAVGPSPDPTGVRPWSLGLLALVYGQIVLGAWLRHFGTLWSLFAHGAMAVAVLTVALRLAWNVLRNRAGSESLQWPARFLAISVVLQALLGLGALLYLLPFGGVPMPVGLYEAMVRTGHQTNAALLLASSVVLALRARRHFCATLDDSIAGWGTPSESKSGLAPASLEVVA